MRYGQVPGITKPVSRLVQGVARAKAGEEREQLLPLLDLAMEQGVNSFDTASVYGAARERALGEWVRSRGVRDEVVILGKGAHHGKDRKRVTPEDIAVDLNESLERMQLDSIDLYILHRDDPDVPVGPIVEALNEQARAGRITAFGGSNWSHQRIQAANDYARAHGLQPFSVSSPNLSLAEQVQEPWRDCIAISGEKGEEARRYYSEHADEVAVMSWSSLSGGFFSGRFTRESVEIMRTTKSYYDELVVDSYCYERNFQRLDRVQELATRKGVSTSQIALAYVLNQPMNIFALMYCEDREQFAANSAALDIELAPTEMDWLDLKTESIPL